MWRIQLTSYTLWNQRNKALFSYYKHIVFVVDKFIFGDFFASLYKQAGYGEGKESILPLPSDDQLHQDHQFPQVTQDPVSSRHATLVDV